jgi:methyl-accepting chemotaxis protein
MNYQTIPNNRSARDKVLVMGQEMSTLGNVLSNEDGRISYVVNEESTLAGALGDNGTWKEYYLQQQTSSGEQKEIAPHGTVAISPDPGVLYEPYGNEHNINLSEVGWDGKVYDIGTPGGALSKSVGPEHADKEYIATARRIDYGRNQFLIVLHTPKEDAYGFAQSVNRNGTIITAGGVFLIVLVGGIIGRNTSRSLEQLRHKAEQMEEGDLSVDLQSQRIDSIGRLYEGFDSMRTSLQTQIHNVQEARQDAEEARDRTKQINEHLQTKADAYSDVMRECAQGDLTARMDPESDNEAMREIAEEFNAMIRQLEHTTEQVKLFAEQVAAASEEVTASSEEVRNASEQVSNSIQEISGGADRQNQRLQTVEQEMNHLSTTTEEIAASSNEVAQLAENTAKTGRKGRKAAKMAVQSMDDIEEGSEDAVAAIEDLESQMERVDELLEFISDLAQETNMLALNANIEASRGRENGGDGEADGFAVVAEEVKELATETKEATEDIEQILEGLRRQTDTTAEEVQQTADRIADSQDAIENAAHALSKIADYAEETNAGVQEISDATEDQASSVQEVVSMINEVASISEETSSESENVAAAAEEQTSSLTEVTRSAEDLAHQASELSEALDQFETDPREDEDGGFTFGAVPDGNQGAASFK